jgi:hypothetical protein
MASRLFLAVCVIAVGFFLFVLGHFITEEKRNQVDVTGER